ncbi:MAG: bifunctional DNA-formamidopyrimidine glycosylase/DNA-(apurinic or apyrimidinic site) lyase [Rhodobacteraceae bacterium]|nr:bifunctional DNA-formamidopyrimidine glycosylase/DNA-(apurinic or apyrimidinic site) lyase [Paracoccaceae bacterium]
MPELPEVETVKRGLEPVMLGRVIARADIRRPDLRRPFPEQMGERLKGARVEGMRRRSKYILVDLSSAETLLIHLGMTGRMLIAPPTEGCRQATGEFHHNHPAPEKHDHVVLDMEDGTRITFNDARRFGVMDLTPTNQVDQHKLLQALGPEPLGNAFDEPYLVAKLKGKNTPVKSALLDQRIVAGLGNIYVCEALYRAGISPLAKAGKLSSKRASALVPVIRKVLAEAIESGGSSLKDYRQTDGELGYFQHSFSTYGREGETCNTPNCTGIIHRIVQSGRSSFYCPRCQR